MSIITENPCWSLIFAITIAGMLLWAYRFYQWSKISRYVPNKGLHGRPKGNEVTRSLANEELARLREIGGNGSHKKAS